MDKTIESCKAKKLLVLLLGGIISSVIAQLFIAQPAQAVCSYQGQTLQTGQTSGPLICMPDGSMQPQ